MKADAQEVFQHPTEALALAYASIAGRADADAALRVMAAKGRREMQANGFDIERLANIPDVPDNAHIKAVSKSLAAARTVRMADAPIAKDGDDGRSVNVLQMLWSMGVGLVPRAPLGENET